jgi:hypothetical protein
LTTPDKLFFSAEAGKPFVNLRPGESTGQPKPLKAKKIHQVNLNRPRFRNGKDLPELPIPEPDKSRSHITTLELKTPSTACRLPKSVFLPIRPKNKAEISLLSSDLRLRHIMTPVFPPNQK